MLILVLKDSLRTFFKSLSWSLGSGPCLVGQVLVLILVLVLVFSPCKDLFPLFHYSDSFTYYCNIIVVSMHTISFNYTYLCLSCRHIALRLKMLCLWSCHVLLFMLLL